MFRSWILKALAFEMVNKEHRPCNPLSDRGQLSKKLPFLLLRAFALVRESKDLRGQNGASWTRRRRAALGLQALTSISPGPTGRGRRFTVARTAIILSGI